jgi:hypothetical protein
MYGYPSLSWYGDAQGSVVVYDFASEDSMASGVNDCLDAAM